MKSAFLAVALSLVSVCALGNPKIFDLHVHLHEGEASIPKYQKQLEEAHVSVAGFGAMWFGGGHQAPAGHIAETRANNDAIVDMATRHPGLLPIATVHPYDGQAAIDELTRVAKKGVKVLKLHAHTQQFDVKDPRVLALVKHAGELGLVVLMDNAGIIAGDCENLFNLAVQSPGTRFIFAHMGGLNFRFWNIIALARTAEGFFGDNIYFDVSGTTVLAAGSPIEAEFVWTIRNVGVDHVLLGSDFPQISLPQTLAAFDRLGLTESEKDAIRWGNASRLLGLE